MAARPIEKTPLICVVGLTASGKTSLGIQIAQQYNGEIICADSRTVYRGMDIGTAKPTLQERAAVPHHLLDILDPGEVFSAAQFKTMADQKIEEIASRDKLPILVGGTGLYVDSVIFDYEFGTKGKTKQREELEKYTTDELKEKLRRQNITVPQNEKNRRHLVRMLEKGEESPNNRSTLRSHTLVIGLQPPKGILRKRIETRIQEMLKNGVLDEVRTLSQRYGWENEAMTGNIYPIFRGVIEGRKRISEAANEAVRGDLYLAKRQRTWFKRNPFIHWVDSPQEALGLVDAFLRQ